MMSFLFIDISEKNGDNQVQFDNMNFQRNLELFMFHWEYFETQRNKEIGRRVKQNCTELQGHKLHLLQLKKDK